MSTGNGASPPALDHRLFSDLHEQPGVTGVCLLAGGQVLSHNLPYADERVGDLASHVERLCLSYENVGRGIWQILAGFDTHWLLILSHQRLRLGVLLAPNTDPSPITSRGTRLLMEVAPMVLIEEQAPAPAEPAAAPGWSRPEFEKKLTVLLGRVAGQETARKIVLRELGRAGAGDPLSIAEVRQLGLAVLETIPNRGKRQALTEEFLNLLQP